jgi:RNA polymerase sigma factor (sigma-70 family)
MEYLHTNLNRFTAIANKYLYEFGIGNILNPGDLVNQTYIKLYGACFNSESHFCGSFCKTMKLYCYTEARGIRRNKEVNWNNFYQFEEIEEAMTDSFDEAVLRTCIDAEQNLRHKEAILLVAQGFSYDYIADVLGITRKNIRFHVFEAKRKLIARLTAALPSMKLSNNGYVRSKINLTIIVENAKYYNDWIVGNKNYRDAILFVLKKEKRLGYHEFVSIIARNKRSKFSDCKNPFIIAVRKMIDEGVVGLEND